MIRKIQLRNELKILTDKSPKKIAEKLMQRCPIHMSSGKCNSEQHCDTTAYLFFMLGHSFVSYSLQSHGLQPSRPLSSWNFIGKNTRVSYYFLGDLTCVSCASCTGRRILYHQTLEALHTYKNGQNLEHQQHQILLKIQSNRNPHTLLGETQNDTATLEDNFRFLTKVNTLLPYDLTTLFAIYPKKLEICVNTKTCTQIFIETLFVTAILGSNKNVRQ